MDTFTTSDTTTSDTTTSAGKPLRVAVIAGSTRPTRRSPAIARWVTQDNSRPDLCLAPGLMEALNPRRMRAMAAPRKYPDELRERAIRLTVDARKDPASRPGACRRIGEQLGINPETLRGWVTQVEVDEGARAGTTTTDAQRLSELEREVKELRRTNAILRSASAFFAAELDRPQR